MKKSIFLLTAIAALLLAGCTLDQTKEINNRGRAIDFRTSFNKTRATEITTSDLTSIYVTAISVDESGTEGLNYFTNLEFKNNDGTYSSDPVYYYPGTGSLNFYAFSPDVTYGATIKKDTKTISFTPANDIKDQVDLVTASATGDKESGKNGVQLDFTHVLSQIEIRAKCGNDDDTHWTVYVYGVKIVNPVSKGTYDFTKASDSWTRSTEEEDKAIYAVEYTNPRTLAADAVSLMDEDAGNAMLIPQSLTAWDIEDDKINDHKGALLEVEIRAVRTDGYIYIPKDHASTGSGTVAWPIDTEWEQGYHYIYTLDFTSCLGVYPPDDPNNPGEPVISDVPINFTVDVTDWGDPTTLDPAFNGNIDMD